MKVQVKSAGLVQIAKRCTNVFAVNRTPKEFCERHSEGFEGGGISEGDACEMVDQARTAFVLCDRDLILGQREVRFRSFY